MWRGRATKAPLALSERADGPTDPLWLIVPGSISTCSGGYEYDRRMAAALEGRGWEVNIHECGEGFPFPSPSTRHAAADLLSRLPDGGLVVIDGLAFGALPEEVAPHRERLRFVALVHHPLAAETGLGHETSVALHLSEARALECARLVVVTSRATADALPAYRIPRNRVAVVEPGTDPAPLATGSGSPDLALLAVGTLIPRKGFEILIEALAGVADRRWHLTCAGSLERDPETARRVETLVARTGLSERVTFAGELRSDDLGRLYDRADVFVLPTLYEGYGMAVAEALARGLPVVSTPTGGIPELVGDDAGLLVPPGDVPALTQALSLILDHAALRVRLRQGAGRVRELLPTWNQRAEQMEAVLRSLH